MIYLTQLIYVKEGQEEIFHQFENHVLPLLGKHSGKVLQRIRPTAESFIEGDSEPPYEIHFISFETETGFQDYLNDKNRTRHMSLKDASVRSSFLVKGSKV